MRKEQVCKAKVKQFARKKETRKKEIKPEVP